MTSTTTSDTHRSDPATWQAFLNALPIPAAVLDHRGGVIVANSWIAAQSGELLFDAQLRVGIDHVDSDGVTWNIAALDTDHLLVTAGSARAGDHLIRRLFATSDVLFAIFDERGGIVECNEGWQRMLGRPPAQLLGVDSWSLVHPDDLVTRSIVERELRQNGQSEPSWRMAHDDGSYRVIHWQLYFDPAIGRCFAVGRDISAHEERGDRLHKRAYTDALTGLPNRIHVLAELERHLNAGRMPAALFCDLDHFKLINDSLGHAAGDQLLAALTKRLNHVLKARDCIIGRFGGDEFVVVIPDADTNIAELIAADIARALRQPFAHRDRTIHLTMSIGIAVCARTAHLTADELLRRADIASYRAKSQGRGTHTLFDGELEAMINRRVGIEAELRAALSRGAIEAWFQPIVDIATGQPIAVETLARLRRSTGSSDAIAGPKEFLDVAVAAGLMPELGRYVIEQALDLAVQVFAERPASDIQFSVNVSATELIAESFTTWFLSAVRQRKLPTRNIVIEVTEAAVLSGETVQAALVSLRDEGFSIVLDDFGTGYSALAHLRDLPISAVKIDRSFVDDIEREPTTKALVRSLYELLTALDLLVVVEGVESGAQAEELQAIGFTMAQGWHFERAMSGDDLLSYLRRH